MLVMPLPSPISASMPAALTVFSYHNITTPLLCARYLLLSATILNYDHDPNHDWQKARLHLLRLHQEPRPRQASYRSYLTIMAANGRLVWVPAGTKGLRVKGWENKIKNMPEEATSDYTTLNVYILDDIDLGANAGAQGNAAQLRHAQWCNNMRDAFDDTVADCNVKSIRMQNGQRSKHLLQHIEDILSTKTEDDLVVFCFHGTAGGDGNGYTL
jgi:hypothetical protein